MNPDARFDVVVEQVAAKVMDGEVVVINLSTGSYYTANETAGSIWPQIEGSCRASEMVDRLCARYDVDRPRAEADLGSLLDQLQAEGIIRPAAAGPGALPADEPAPAARLPYAPPTLEVFRDMEQLLALDPPMPDVGEIPWRRTGGDDGA